jgi:uncharacterized YigZ family protein
MTDPARYLVPATVRRVHDEIERSRFITTLAYTPSEADARAFISAVSSEFADASHSCWAYVIGQPGSTARIGLSDAGEPHGTAGRPMLNVLLHSQVGDICAVVTRYFGGVLLGKGGLVRAYSGGVAHALQTLPTLELIPKTAFSLVFEYTYVTSIRLILQEHAAELMSEEYAADVTYGVVLPSDSAAAFTRAVVDATCGAVLIEPIEQQSRSP